MSNNQLKQAPEEVIFSLDIGTRTVVGTLSRKEDDQYIILDHEMLAHPERAMYDGQIHDIEKVSKVAKRIKETLESRNDFTLNKVAIAAAGRALRTAKVAVSQELDETKEITKEIIDGVEMQAIQEAQREICPDKLSTEVKYYCVGYSVMRYTLDDSMILNPKGHRGNELGVELIATFLPHIVVDSLYTVMSNIGLEVISMTLEPIAAINVAIPDNLRLLNLALVDVGAGTSDIAITKDGTIVSYGMVAMAGDELTEALAREYLLDFNTAERVKMDLMTQEEVRFTDVIGMDHRIHRDEIIERIKPALERLTQAIADSIMSFNAKAPSAIFCIGGGCQIPSFTDMLAEALNLPKERTVIKGTESIQNLVFECGKLSGPEFVTPVGIGFTAAKEKENDFLQVTVNDKVVRLFNSRELSVSDALVLVGYNARHLMPAKSEGYLINENGKERRIYGGYGEPAMIYVNGALSSLDAKLKNKDTVYVEPAIPGQNIYYKVGELIKCPQIKYHETPLKLVNDVTLNGKPVREDLSDRVGENDTLAYMTVKTVGDLRAWKCVGEEQAFVVNGELASDDSVLNDKDQVELIRVIRASAELEVKEYVAGNESHVTHVDHGNHGNKTAPVGQAAPVGQTGPIVDLSHLQDFSYTPETIAQPHISKGRIFHIIVNDRKMEIDHSRTDMIFVDIFDYYQFDRTEPKGIVDLKLNGKRANYTDALKDGDVLEIGWR